MKELQHFGWNTLTLSFAGVLVFSILGARGLFRQTQMIWRNRSGRAISTTFFSMLLAVFVSGTIYGFETKSLALIVHGCLRIPFAAAVVLGLAKFEGFTRRDKFLLSLLSAGLVGMVVLPWKALFFLGFSYLLIGATCLQPLEIWRKKTAGVVSLELLVVFLASATFWTVYGASLGDSPIFLTSASYILIYLVTITLWVVYRRRDRERGALTRPPAQTAFEKGVAE